MSEPKTRPTDASVEEFIASVDNETRREDAWDLLEVMRDVTGVEPIMWGNAIVGFGTQTATYASGKTMDWFIVGFSPRKQATTVYLMDGVEAHTEALERLGPHKLGRACLYITRLERVDTDVLRELVEDAWSLPE